MENILLDFIRSCLNLKRLTPLSIMSLSLFTTTTKQFYRRCYTYHRTKQGEVIMNSYIYIHILVIVLDCLFDIVIKYESYMI